MRDPDTFRKGFGEVLDRIAPMQGAKRRRFRQWALADSADRVAPRTIGLRKGAAPINLGDLRSSARE
jgi:hypothetical protein